MPKINCYSLYVNTSFLPNNLSLIASFQLQYFSQLVIHLLYYFLLESFKIQSPYQSVINLTTHFRTSLITFYHFHCLFLLFLFPKRNSLLVGSLLIKFFLSAVSTAFHFLKVINLVFVPMCSLNSKDSCIQEFEFPISFLILRISLCSPADYFNFHLSQKH